MKIKDLMLTDVEIVERDATLYECAYIMKSSAVAFLPVVDDERVVGVVTDRDIVARGVAEGMDSAEAKVRDVMTREVVSCREDDDLSAARKLMSRRQVRRVVVVDKEDKLAGLLDQVLLPAVDRERGAEVRIGFMVHELRNALACVVVAYGLVKKALAGADSEASALMERNLGHMRDMIDRAFSEVRLNSKPQAHRKRMLLREAVDDVALTASAEARRKGVTLSVLVDPKLEIEADREYLASALANLLQNAVKFTKPGGGVWVRSLERDRSIVLEVEDQCGGLPGGEVEKLFRPFVQMSDDRGGLGLGLAISRRAVELNEGAITARDIPGSGCVFSVTLPKIVRREPVAPRV